MRKLLWIFFMVAALGPIFGWLLTDVVGNQAAGFTAAVSWVGFWGFAGGWAGDKHI